jgi:hypothetical protein
MSWQKWDYLKPHHPIHCCFTSHKLPYGLEMDDVVCNWFFFDHLGHVMTDLGLGKSKNWHNNKPMNW